MEKKYTIKEILSAVNEFQANNENKIVVLQRINKLLTIWTFHQIL